MKLAVSSVALLIASNGGLLSVAQSSDPCYFQALSSCNGCTSTKGSNGLSCNYCYIPANAGTGQDAIAECVPSGGCTAFSSLSAQTYTAATCSSAPANPNAGGANPSNGNGAGGIGDLGTVQSYYPSTIPAVGAAFLALSFLIVVLGVAGWFAFLTVQNNIISAAAKPTIVSPNPLGAAAAGGTAVAVGGGATVVVGTPVVTVSRPPVAAIPGIFYQQLSTHANVRRLALFSLVALALLNFIWIIIAYAGPWASLQVQTSDPIFGVHSTSILGFLLTGQSCSGGTCISGNIDNSKLKAAFAMLILSWFASIVVLAVACICAFNVAARHGKGLGAILPSLPLEFIGLVATAVCLFLNFIGVIIGGVEYATLGQGVYGRAAALGFGVMSLFFEVVIGALLFALWKKPFVVKGATRRGSMAASPAPTPNAANANRPVVVVAQAATNANGDVTLATPGGGIPGVGKTSYVPTVV